MKSQYMYTDAWWVERRKYVCNEYTTDAQLLSTDCKIYFTFCFLFLHLPVQWDWAFKFHFLICVSKWVTSTVFAFCFKSYRYICRLKYDYLYLPLNYHLISRYLWMLFLLHFTFALPLQQGSVNEIATVSKLNFRLFFWPPICISTLIDCIGFYVVSAMF